MLSTLRSSTSRYSLLTVIAFTMFSAPVAAAPDPSALTPFAASNAILDIIWAFIDEFQLIFAAILSLFGLFQLLMAGIKTKERTTYFTRFGISMAAAVGIMTFDSILQFFTSVIEDEGGETGGIQETIDPEPLADTALGTIDVTAQAVATNAVYLSEATGVVLHVFPTVF